MKYFKNTLWLLAERMFQMGSSFLVIILLTRYLGPENYGILSYSQSFVGIFVAFSTLGLEVILVREITKNKSESNTLLGTALVLKLTASFIAILLIFVINSSQDDSKIVLITNIIAFSLIFNSLNLGIDTFFQANVISRYSAICKMIVSIFSSALKLFLIYIEADLIYFACIITLDGLFLLLGYVYIYTYQKRSVFDLNFDKKTATNLIKNGWPMMLVAVAVFLYTKIDQIMISNMLNNESVGYYAAAVKVTEIFYFIPLLITQSIFPRIVEIKGSGNTKEYFQLIGKSYKLVLWISLPIVFLLVVFNEMIINVLYGNSFEQSTEILSVLAFCLIFVSIGSVNTKILYVEKYEIKYLKRSILGVFVNITLNYYLIAEYGSIGAAFSTLFTLFFIHYIYDIFDKDLLKFYHLKLKCFWPKY